MDVIIGPLKNCEMKSNNKETGELAAHLRCTTPAATATYICASRIVNNSQALFVISATGISQCVYMMV